MQRTLIILSLILQVAISALHGQRSDYGISVVPNLTPPYSLKLSDYSKFGSQQLVVTITVNDLGISNLPVKLRIKMESVGVTIENPLTINATPIYLDGGATMILFGRDLIDYFNINNLIFKGYSKETYNRTGQLPEGFYKFTVEVVHYHTNRVISNQGFTTAWIALGKPPILKLPKDDAEMGQFQGMPLTFSWLASNVGTPLSAGSIQYKFEMWEMRIDGISPYTVAASTPVFHEHTSFNTQYVLYPVTLLMEPGMKFAWRVTASDISGFVPFEQDGHSEIRTFTYKAKCDTVEEFTGSQRNRTGLFTWEPQSNHTSFNIELREQTTGWGSKSQTFENSAEFFDLDYGKTYEMRVQAECNGDPQSVSDYTNWVSVSIPYLKPRTDTITCPNCACDDDIPDVRLTNFKLRKDLQPGDIITNKTGTTRYIIKTVAQQENGMYTGSLLVWSEIWNLKFICNYWDLQVNTDNVAVNIDYESVYDPQFVLNIDEIVDAVGDLSDAVGILTTPTSIKDTLTINETISSIYVNEAHELVALTVGEDGKIQEKVIQSDVGELSQTLIKGKDGEEYVVTRKGEVMGVDEYVNTGGNRQQLEQYSKEKESKASPDVTVDFMAFEGQEYGFDMYNGSKQALQQQYPTMQNGYSPPYKSIESYKTDKVKVSYGDKIIFKDEMGIPALHNGSELTVRGAADGDMVKLYAYQEIDSIEKMVGKLNIHSYDKNPKRLYIVPVNGAYVPKSEDLKNAINEIYKQAVAEWTVTATGNLDNVVFENGNMTHGGSKGLSTYNTDQKKIVKEYVTQYGKLEQDAYYLFFVENVQFKERSIAGFMPLQRQVGYIYGNPSLQTVAHELGHGAYNLRHTFDTEGFLAAEQTTDNLMDYSGGSELWKHQWENVQSPDNILMAWMQEEEEGESAALASPEQNIKRLVELFRCAYSSGSTFNFPTPYYKLITNNQYLENVTFPNNIEYTVAIEFYRDILDFSPNRISYIEENGYYWYRFKDFKIGVSSDISSFDNYLFPNPTEFKSQSNQIAALEKQNISSGNVRDAAKALYESSRCIISHLTYPEKIEILTYIADLTIQEDRLDYTVVDIISSIAESQTESVQFFEDIEENPNLIISLYLGTDDEYTNRLLVNNLVKIFAAYWNNKEFTVDDNKHFTRGTADRYTANLPKLHSVSTAITFKIWKNHDVRTQIQVGVACSPLEPVALVEFASNSDIENTVAYIPAIYLHFIEETQTQENLKGFLTGAIQIAAGVSSVGLIYKGASAVQKIIGVVELANMGTNLALQSPAIRARIEATPEGIEFLKVWPTISTTLDLATLGTDMLDLFASSGRKVLNDCDDILSDLEKQHISSKIDESQRIVLQLRINQFNVGDHILLKPIARVRKGTNGKVAVIGRKMDKHVNDVAIELKRQGFEVSILDDTYLKDLYGENFGFMIDGKKWTVDEAWADMVDEENYIKYKIDAPNDSDILHSQDGMIKEEFLPRTIMYKVNQQWIEMMVEEGYTILDFNYPLGLNLNQSAFYNMEVKTVLWD